MDENDLEDEYYDFTNRKKRVQLEKRKEKRKNSRKETSYKDFQRKLRLSDDHIDEHYSPKNTINNETFDYQYTYQKLLEIIQLEKPEITPRMVDYFLQNDMVCALLISFVTCLKDEGQNDEKSLLQLLNGPIDRSLIPNECYTNRCETADAPKVEEMTVFYSYQVMTLLTNPSNESMRLLMHEKCSLFTTCLLSLFQPNSNGNFYHGCGILHALLQHSPDEFYAALIKKFPLSIEYMMEYLSISCVNELFLPIISRSIVDLRMTESVPLVTLNRTIFMDQLIQWNIIQRFIESMISTKVEEETNVIYCELFSDILQNLLADNEESSLKFFRKLVEENVMEILLDAALIPEMSAAEPKRSLQITALLRCVYTIFEKCTMPTIRVFVRKPYLSFGRMLFEEIPNTLYAFHSEFMKKSSKHCELLKSYLLNNAISNLTAIQDLETYFQSYETFQFLCNTKDTEVNENATNLQFSSYTVQPPFGERRLLAMNMLVILVTQNPSLLLTFDYTFWKLLILWFFQYPHNNFYHYAFSKLFYTAIRCKEETVYEILFKRLKLLSIFILYYRNVEIPTSNKGHILQCCNILRLENELLPIDSYLYTYLKYHHLWQEFNIELREITTLNQKKGMGYPIPKNPCLMEKDTLSFNDNGIDCGSNFAESLGFINELIRRNINITTLEIPKSDVEEVNRTEITPPLDTTALEDFLQDIADEK